MLGDDLGVLNFSNVADLCYHPENMILIQLFVV